MARQHAGGEGRAKHARAGSLVLLAVLAVAGNLLSVHLLFGIRFFFGGAAALLALRLHGRVAGVLIGTLAAAVAYSQGAGPWLVPALVLEVLLVGLAQRRAAVNLLVLDATYWLLVGMPVGVVLEVAIVGRADTATVVIALKQGVNGIACALLASAAATHVRFLRRLGGERRPVAVSLHDTLFHLFVALVLVPALVLLFVAGRLEIDERRDVLVEHLHAASDETSTHLRQWVELHRTAVAALADEAKGLTDGPSPRLQHLTRIFAESFPDFHNVYVADARARTIAFHPPVNERGESTIGLDFSDRTYYQELVRRLAPVTSDVFRGRGGVFVPIVTISAPILEDGHFAGFALGALDLGHVRALLAEPQRGRGVQLTLLDGAGQVVATTIQSREPMEGRADPVASWPRVPEGPGLYLQWPPEVSGAGEFVRWHAAREVLESEIGAGIPWTLVAEAPLAPLQDQLLALYARDLVAMLVVTLVTLLLAGALSRWIVRPLRQLAQDTRDLPERLTSLDAPPPTWPSATETEIAALIENFRSMTGALTESFRDLRERSRQLARTNEDLRTEAHEREGLEIRVRQKHALEALGTLAGGIAHDFNNVLTTVLGNVEIARRQADLSPALVESLDEIEHAGERARQLVRQILTFSRRGGTERLVVSLADTARDAVRLLRSSLDPAVRIEADLPEGRARVLADPIQLFQVVANLCTNAEHALRASGGRIDVEVHEEVDGPRRHAVLSVRDDGPGMAPEVRERAFEPFFTTKPPGEGTGMGLAVVHGIVTEHGGSVSIESVPGHGTTVRVVLPLAESAAQDSAKTDPTADAPAPGGPLGGRPGCRVLLAEDEASIARLVRDTLVEQGCEVVARADGREALAAFMEDDRGFDAIVTDLAMPGLSGAAFIRALRSRDPDVAIVLCTGFRDELPDQAIEALGIDAVVLKPFRAMDLAQEVCRVVRARGGRPGGAPPAA